jgi:hypothetical protein
VTHLRKGRIENPGYEKLRTIAEAMGFPPELWFADAVESLEEVPGIRSSWFVDREDNLTLLDEEVVEALGDETVRAVLREVMRLPERERKIVLGIVRQAIPAEEWCWSHHPDHEEQRRRRASKGGRRGGRGRPSVELARLQARFEDLAEKVLSGEIERGVGAVVGQLLNGARACVRDALAAREQEELVARLEALEEALEANARDGRSGRYGTY